MAISKDKTRLVVSMRKETADLIDKFAEATHMTKSEFVENVCIAFIKDVCETQKKMRKQAEEKK